MLKNVISVIDGAAGSCGKAKVVGEIATDKNINLGAAITNCMPNAGHTFVDEQGHRTLFRNIPVSCVNPHTELFIGPGSAIDMAVIKEEYQNVRHFLNGRKIYVHELVPLIEQSHKDYEKTHIKSGSTNKGCGAVSMAKIIRDENLQFFKSYEDLVVCSNDEWLDRLYSHLDNPNEYVLLEGAQGCDLDLNHSGNYPYVTSRNVSTTQLLADSGISAERLLETIMVIRPFPIRINNVTPSGEYHYTGDYGTGAKLTWMQVNLSSMFGQYPCEGDVECFNHHINYTYIKKLLTKCPSMYLKQLFGPNFRQKDLTTITLLEALELERLYHKSKGEDIYESAIIELPMVDSDFPPNTIIDQSEQTSVTKMERRIFDLDIQKLKNNCRINSPYGLYLNFFQHLDYDFFATVGDFNKMYFDRYQREYLSWLENETGAEILALGTGSKNNDRILKKELVKPIAK